MNINTNHNFLAFEKQIDSARAWLQAKVSDACGYPREVLADRLMQRIVEISLQPYTLAVSVLCKITDHCFPAPGAQLDCRRARMEIGSGRMTVTPGQWLANQIEFILHWAYCLLAILDVTRAGADNTPTVLVFGIGEESIFCDGDDEKFVTYCRSGPIDPLRAGKRFLIQSASSHTSSAHPDFEYSRRPLISLLRKSSLGSAGRLRLLTHHLKLFFVYLYSTARQPLLTLLGRDFAYGSIACELDNSGLMASVVLTSADNPVQALWLRTLRQTKVHMIWYSQSAKQIAYAPDYLDSPMPTYRWIRVDVQWVWTRAFAEYLGTYCPNQSIEVVGPIVWYMPESKALPKSVVEIAIFDVSPYTEKIAIACGEISNYYHPDNMLAFVRDVISMKPALEMAFHLPVAFRLKTKRGFKISYDKAYFDFLEELASENAIVLEHHSTNMYSLISGSHLVIAYPFTSPAYIADFLKVPSVYYDPTQSILRQDFRDAPSLMDFASTPEALLVAAINAITGSIESARLYECGQPLTPHPPQSSP